MVKCRATVRLLPRGGRVQLPAGGHGSHHPPYVWQRPRPGRLQGQVWFPVRENDLETFSNILSVVRSIRFHHIYPSPPPIESKRNSSHQFRSFVSFFNFPFYSRFLVGGTPSNRRRPPSCKPSPRLRRSKRGINCDLSSFELSISSYV
jgi:hypothetical protein